jgi:hypothetical protein
MTTQIDRVPFNTIPQEWAFHPEIGPFIRDLLRIVWQQRDRLGGDGDIITEIVVQADDSMGSAVESRVAALEARIIELQIEHDFSSRLAAIEAKLAALEVETHIQPHVESVEQDMQNTLVYDLIERVKAIEVQI